MADICGTCKGKVKREFWHRRAVTKKFFKVMPRDFEHQLRIPREFVKNFRGRLSGPITLIGPNKNEWKVQLERREEEVLFSTGWEKFVQDQDIDLRDFLVFTYMGNLTFEVVVFTSTGCELESSHFTSVDSDSSCKCTLHVERNDYPETQDVSSDFALGETEMKFSQASAEESHKRTAETSHYNAVYKGKRKLVSFPHFGESDESDNDSDFADNKYEDEDEEGEHEELFSCSPPIASGKQTQKCHISHRRSVTEKEKERVWKLSAEFIKQRKSSGVPMVGVVMLPTHVYKGLYLTIPKEWAMKNMITKDHQVELRVEGVHDFWLVGCRWTRSSTAQCQFRPRWADFALNNNLEEGDICVFEMVQKGNLKAKRRPVFCVHIFRVVEEVVPLTAKRIV